MCSDPKIVQQRRGRHRRPSSCPLCSLHCLLLHFWEQSYWISRYDWSFTFQKGLAHTRNELIATVARRLSHVFFHSKARTMNVPRKKMERARWAKFSWFPITTLKVNHSVGTLHLCRRRFAFFFFSPSYLSLFSLFSHNTIYYYYY